MNQLLLIKKILAIYNIMTTNKILENYMCHNLQLTALRFYFKLFISTSTNCH